jgi:hypothetical protein
MPIDPLMLDVQFDSAGKCTGTRVRSS